MRPLVCNWKNLADEVLQPLLHRPNHPFQLARFGAAALCSASLLAKLLLRREDSRALFAGMAAHSFLPLEALGSASFGLVLGMAGHAVGWPLPGAARMRSRKPSPDIYASSVAQLNSTDASLI